MASRARSVWGTQAAEHLDQLVQIHAVVRGQGPGRRWYTSALNQGMFVALVAQFQTFSRELHDEAVQVIVREADQRLAGLLERALRHNRKLDSSNPWPRNLYEDFSRLGIDLKSPLEGSYSKARDDLNRLEPLLNFRNAAAHGNQGSLGSLVAEGQIKSNLQSFDRYRKTIDRIVKGMDKVVASELSATLQIGRPW